MKRHILSSGRRNLLQKSWPMLNPERLLHNGYFIVLGCTKSLKALLIGNPLLPPSVSGLPGAEAEVSIVSAILDSRVHFGAQATKMSFCEEAPGADIILLSTHALPRPFNPLFGSFLLGDSPLRVIDLIRMDLKASLAVLSGCDTHVDTVNPGDESMGLTSAFLAAGVESVISAMWEAEDNASKSLMSHFFLHHIKGGLNKARALRLAQIEVMNTQSANKSLSNPYYWAPFVLTGNYE